MMSSVEEKGVKTLKGILKGIGAFLGYLILMMIFQAVSSIGFMGIAAAKGCRDEHLINEFANNNLLGITIISGILIALAFLFKFCKADIKKEWKLRKPDRILLMLSAAAAFSYSLMFFLLSYNASVENTLMIQKSAEYYSSVFPGLGIIMMVANLIVIAPISEEIALRGVVFTRIETESSPITAVVVSSLLFGLMHLMAGGIVLVMGGFIMGALLGLIFYKTNSLPACFIAHAIANLPDLIFYAHPELSSRALVLLEIISGMVFIFGIILLLGKRKDDNYDRHNGH